jgi:hypothetical protein
MARSLIATDAELDLVREFVPHAPIDEVLATVCRDQRGTTLTIDVRPANSSRVLRIVATVEQAVEL